MSESGPALTAALHARAALYRQIREFFQHRQVLEVETPLLCSSGVTDPSIEPLIVERGTSLTAPRYLQTSPEYAMKRLLAAGSGAIYQIARAFRDGEAGTRHNPEFTMLEWYRPGLDHRALMAEVADLLQHCLGERAVHAFSYREAFTQFLGLDPFLADTAELAARAREVLDVGGLSGDRDMWLDLLMSHLVEPQLASLEICFIYDYPASQAALARISTRDGVSVGHRFEAYVDGIELANGYWELTDPVEQRRRFEADNARRREFGLAERPLDENLLAAMEEGLPECAGVALGLDRLLMLATGTRDIRAVIAFDWQQS